MKQKNVLLWVLAAAVVILCLVVVFTTSKSAKIKKVEKFTAQVEENYQNYSSSDLEKAQAKFEKIVEKVEKKKLTGEEESHINELKGQCKGYFAQAKARLILQDFNKALDDAGDEVKGVIKSLNEEE